MTVLKMLVGAFVVTAFVLMFLICMYETCKNDDPSILLSKAIGVIIGVVLVVLGIWAFS